MVQAASVLVDTTDQLSTPYFHFAICVDNYIVGAINFRLTKNKRIVEYYGHLGFEVVERYRGYGLAYKGCQLVAPYIQALGYRRVIITCHPSNIASRKTIEKLGAKFITYRDFPQRTDDHESERLIYCWEP